MEKDIDPFEKALDPQYEVDVISASRKTWDGTNQRFVLAPLQF